MSKDFLLSNTAAAIILLPDLNEFFHGIGSGLIGKLDFSLVPNFSKNRRVAIIVERVLIVPQAVCGQYIFMVNILQEFQVLTTREVSNSGFVRFEQIQEVVNF